MDQHRSNIPQAAAALGYVGALPFILVAFAIWFVTPSQLIVLLGFLKLAGAVVLGFIGGIHLGISMTRENGPTFLQLGMGAIVIAVSAIVTIADPSRALIILIIAFPLQLWTDLRTVSDGRAPAWYPGLRIPLTLLVELSLLGAFIKVALG